MSVPVSDDDLNAYVDGQLPPERAARVAADVEGDPAFAARAAAIRAHNAQLRNALDPWLSEPLPRELIGAATSSKSHRRGLGRRLWPVLATAASLCIGVAIGWLVRGEVLQQAGTPVTFQRQAALTHALYATDANRPVEIWANEEERLVRWLSKRLSFQLHAPSLNDVGFALVLNRVVARRGNDADRCLSPARPDRTGARCPGTQGPGHSHRPG